MTFIPRFSLTGGPMPVFAFGIAASEEWDVYDVLARNAAGDLLEAGAANNDVFGTALGAVGNTTTGQSDADDLRPYLSALVGGKHELVVPFVGFVIYGTQDRNALTTDVTLADLGEIADLELVSSEWGINNGTSATSATPQFRIHDRNIRDLTEYLVVPALLDIADVFQFMDAAV